MQWHHKGDFFNRVMGGWIAQRQRMYISASGPGFDPRHFFNANKINRQPCLEKIGERLNNYDFTQVVLAQLASVWRCSLLDLP